MSLARAELRYVYDLVYKRSAIVLTDDKHYLVENRLAPVATSRGFRSVSELVDALRAEPGPLETAVVEAMTTNETTFFRDQHPFDALAREMLPALVRARAASRSLVVLSAACSTGQEAYSVGMVIREHFPELAQWNVRIIGVDLSHLVLARAKEGIYPEFDAKRGLRPELLSKYFDRVGANYRIKENVRELVEFRQMNLAEPWTALPRVDVLFLRNVLIYFDVATKKTILGHARRVLAEDGYLLLGGSETTLNLDDAFGTVRLGNSLVYRTRAST